MISKWRLVNPLDSIQIHIHPFDTLLLIITRDNVRNASIEGDIFAVTRHILS